MKLWHDDVRRPPDDTWTWARTNKEAIAILNEHEVDEASLDHDLGLDYLDPDGDGVINLAGDSPDGTGYDLARWMCENRRFPKKITVHSWSYSGAARMAKVLIDAGCDVTVRPYRR